jgi:hypothetical protein
LARRCRRFPDGSHELSTKIYDAKGKLQREFLLGDGIEHVQIDRRGNIWVGYFDEGVYGKYAAFPLVRVDQDWNLRAWKTQTAGGREFAVHGEHILVYGGYRENETDCKRLRLGMTPQN